MRRSSLSNALVVIAFLSAAASSHAATIIDDGANTGTSFRIGGPNSQVEGISWTQTDSYTGVEISALIGSIDGSSETVIADLTTAIGSSAGSPIATATITVPSFANASAITAEEIFSGLTLAANTYYLTFFNADSTGSVNIRWAIASPTTTAADASANGAYFANSVGNGTPNTTNPWQSTFVTSTDNFGFTVTGALSAATPEPGTFGPAVVMLSAVVLGWRVRRRG